MGEKTSLDLLNFVSGAVNSKDAFARLVEKCREFSRADGAAALRAHTHRSGYEILITEGRTLKPELVFATSIDMPGVDDREITREKRDLLFVGTRVAANIALRREDDSALAVIRLEWENPEEMAGEVFKTLLSAIPFVTPLMEHFRKYDSRISVHPSGGDGRYEEIDLELDTPDLEIFFRKLHGIITGRIKVAATGCLLRDGDSLVLEPGALLGKTDPLPPRLEKTRESAWLFEAMEEPKPNFPGPGEKPAKSAAVPIVYKGEVLGVMMLIGTRSGPSADDVNVVQEIMSQAAIFLKKAFLYRETRKLGVPPLLLVGVQRDILELAESYAEADASILIKGETGTGKESIARFLHMISPRIGKPFFTFNCAELVDSLAESQLFGHTKGSFTGATQDTIGIFEQADGGTLFLDEIHLLSPPIQAKFLRVIETGEIRPVGSSGPVRKTDVRIIVATNRDLQTMVSEGEFLHDLFMRLDVLEITLVPLRQNRQSLMVIADTILRHLSAKSRKTIEGFTPRAKQALLMYDYPGNIRELRNIIEKAVVLCQEKYIDAPLLPQKLLKIKAVAPGVPEIAATSFEPNYESYKADTERSYVTRLLERAKGSVTEAARLSGLHRTHIYNLMKKHDLTPDRFKS